jgi:hypothetical protein
VDVLSSRILVRPRDVDRADPDGIRIILVQVPADHPPAP